MLLSVGIHILLNPNLSNQYTDYAHQMLVCFVKHYSELFGSDQVVYNDSWIRRCQKSWLTRPHFRISI